MTDLPFTLRLRIVAAFFEVLLQPHRLLETLLLRPIGLSHLGIALGCHCVLYREDSVHDSLQPDLLAELFLFLLFVVVTQGLL